MFGFITKYLPDAGQHHKRRLMTYMQKYRINFVPSLFTKDTKKYIYFQNLSYQMHFNRLCFKWFWLQCIVDCLLHSKHLDLIIKDEKGTMRNRVSGFPSALSYQWVWIKHYLEMNQGYRGRSTPKNMIFFCFDICYSPIFLLSKMGSYFTQISLLLILWSFMWRGYRQI